MAARRGDVGFDSDTVTRSSSLLKLSSTGPTEASSKDPDPGSFCLQIEDDDIDLDERLPTEREAQAAQLGFRSNAETVDVALVCSAAGFWGFDEETSLATDFAERLMNPTPPEPVIDTVLLLLLLPLLLKFSLGIEAALSRDRPTIGLSFDSRREARPEDIV